MKVAVIGASGFVGRHVLRVLRASGDEARAVVRNRSFAPLDPDRRIADACNVDALREALAGYECVVHCMLGAAEVILGSLSKADKWGVPVVKIAASIGRMSLRCSRIRSRHATN